MVSRACSAPERPSSVAVSGDSSAATGPTRASTIGTPRTWLLQKPGCRAPVVNSSGNSSVRAPRSLQLGTADAPTWRSRDEATQIDDDEA